MASAPLVTSDNAGGIAEMALLGPRTDARDAAGIRLRVKTGETPAAEVLCWEKTVTSAFCSKIRAQRALIEESLIRACDPGLIVEWGGSVCPL